MPERRPLNIPVILGTVRKGRATAHAARLFTELLNRRAGVESTLIDIARVPLPVDDAGEAIKDPVFAAAMTAADQLAKEDIRVDVVDLRTVRPMDVEAIATSVRKTNRAVVLEEGWEIAGIGAQVVDFIQRECFDDLDAPVIRVHQADVPMPYAKNLERLAKPDAAKAIAAVKKVMYLE